MVTLRRASSWLSMWVTGTLLLGGCAAPTTFVESPTGHAPSHRETGPATHSSAGQRIARLAEGLVGTPYRYGGEHPAEGFDCSGLVFYTHRQLNLRVPRTSADQYRAAQRVPLSDARPGDLVFFRDARKLSHVGIYLGDRRFVHAPTSGRRVAVARLDAPYYREHLVGLGRLY